jgi:hypothetical protein
VLIGAADIRPYGLENDALIDRLICRFRKVDVLDEVWTSLKTTLAVLVRLPNVTLILSCIRAFLLRQLYMASRQCLDVLILWQIRA